MDTGLARLRTLSLLVTSLAAIACLAGLTQFVLLGKDSFFPTAPVIEVSAADAAAAEDLGEEYFEDDYLDSEIDTMGQVDPYRTYYYDDAYVSTTDTGLAQPVEKTLGERMIDLLGEPEGIAFIVMIAALAAFFVAALMWVWRAHSNLADRGILLKNSPTRAVVSYLVPLLNLVLPFEAMRELYNRSEGEPEELADSSVSDVTAWWTSVAVALMIFVLLAVKYFINFNTPLTFYTPLWMEFVIVGFALLLLLGSTWLFSVLVRKVTSFQHAYLASIEPDEVVDAAPARPSVRIVSTGEA